MNYLLWIDADGIYNMPTDLNWMLGMLKQGNTITTANYARPSWRVNHEWLNTERGA